jgi:hypothetical protein
MDDDLLADDFLGDDLSPEAIQELLAEMGSVVTLEQAAELAELLSAAGSVEDALAVLAQLQGERRAA